VDAARAHPACLGARLSGPGVGGYTVNLVRWDETDEFGLQLEEGYAKATGRKLRTFRCRVVDGARAV
jgi:galactokinase